MGFITGCISESLLTSPLQSLDLGPYRTGSPPKPTETTCCIEVNFLSSEINAEIVRKAVWNGKVKILFLNVFCWNMQAYTCQYQPSCPCKLLKQGIHPRLTFVPNFPIYAYYMTQHQRWGDGGGVLQAARHLCRWPQLWGHFQLFLRRPQQVGYFKPSHYVFLTLTKCFLCVNLSIP